MILLIQALVLILLALPFGLSIHPVGVLLPISFAPPWLRAIAAANPLAYAVDASRAIFNNHLADPSIGIAVVIMAVLAAVAVTLAARQFGRAVA